MDEDTNGVGGAQKENQTPHLRTQTSETKVNLHKMQYVCEQTILLTNNAW